MATVKQYRDCLLNTCIHLYRDELRSSLINKKTEEKNKKVKEENTEDTKKTIDTKINDIKLSNCLANKEFLGSARKQLQTNKLFDPVIDKDMWQARKDLAAELYECYTGEFTS